MVNTPFFPEIHSAASTAPGAENAAIATARPVTAKMLRMPASKFCVAALLGVARSKRGVSR